MEKTLKNLINLNIELEGILRVALNRPTDEALDKAAEKFEEFTAQFEKLERERKDKREKDLTSLKEEEAEGAESTPLEEPNFHDNENEMEILKSIENESNDPGLKKLISLNDKFIFKRELFGGNECEFEDTLSLLCDMNSLEEVEEYLYDDLQWNRDDEKVKKFMAIVSSYFSQKK